MSRFLLVKTLLHTTQFIKSLLKSLKISAINYLIRVNTYPLTKEAKKKEMATIKSVLENKNLSTKHLK
jgi:hypothetical protein